MSADSQLAALSWPVDGRSLARDSAFESACLAAGRPRGYRARQGGINTGTNGVAVYYPFALVALKEFVQSDDHEETGDLLLIFEDNEGAQVTIKVRQSVISQLLERLPRPADPHS